MADPKFDQLAQGIADVSLSEKPDTAAKDTQLAASEAAQAEGRRLYIGNLSYSTTEDDLKNLFKDYIVDSVSIPQNPRNGRHVGYGFIDLSTASEANRAKDNLNSAELLERKISVQFARKHEPGAEGERRPRLGRGRGRFRYPRGRGPRDNQENHGEQGETGTGNESRGLRKPPLRRNHGPPKDGVPSKNKVMVANLPFDMREEKLMEIFKDYEPVSAKIALRPIPVYLARKLKARGEARRGRGFGFVTMPTEELQKKACEEMNDKMVEGRQIAVKVAIDAPGKEDDPQASYKATEAAEGDDGVANGTANGGATLQSSGEAATAA